MDGSLRSIIQPAFRDQDLNLVGNRRHYRATWYETQEDSEPSTVLRKANLIGEAQASTHCRLASNSGLPAIVVSGGFTTLIF
jgi:hypothetical protein